MENDVVRVCTRKSSKMMLMSMITMLGKKPT